MSDLLGTREGKVREANSFTHFGQGDGYMTFLFLNSMTKVKDIVRLVEEVAPLQLQEDYDNAGYQVGDMENEVTSVVVCLDITESVVDRAIELGAGLIISHHPLLFRPIKRITPSDYISRTIIKAIQANITLYSAHTNLDNAYRGVNYRIAEMLSLEDVTPLAPLPAHRLSGIADAGMTGSGLIGRLPAVCSAVELVATVKKIFKCESVRTNLNMLSRPSRLIRTLALCGGSGADLISNAESQNADAYLTGEIGYHHFFGHDEMLLMEAGHFETEQYTRDLIKDIIEEKLPDISIFII